ncbi:MAG: T9SS type A sorting domain-containing protein, partial [Bacteroidia bacterium]
VSGFMITIPLGQLQKVIMDTAFNVLNDYEIRFIEDQKCKNISVLVSLPSDNSKVIPLTASKYLIMGNVDIVDDSVTCRYKAAVSCSIIDTANTITPYFLSKPNTNITLSSISFNTPVDYKYSKTYIAAMLADTLEQDLNFDLAGMNKTPSSIVVTTLDTMGKVVWQKIVGGDMSYNPNSIVVTLDSGCLVAGTRYNYKNPKVANVAESFLLKLDKHGNVQFTSIKENSRFVTHKCYPNPTVDELYFDLPFAANYKIDFYDLYKGNVLYSKSNYANGDKISTKQFSSGMYVYKITNGTNVYSGKFVKE